MANKKCTKCGARNKVDAKICIKCNEPFDKIAPSYIEGSAWSAADAYEEADVGSGKTKKDKVEAEPFWRTIMIIGIILTATLFLIGFGLPLLLIGLYGLAKRLTDTKITIKIGIIVGSLIFGIIIYKFIVFPLFT